MLRPAAALMVVLTACTFPRDPERTLERVSGGVMKVGLVENPPWVVKSSAGATGIEMELLA